MRIAIVAAFLPAPSLATTPSIGLWHGDHQRFGHNGDPQPLVNLLGAVTHPESVAYLSLKVNGKARRPLRWGEDLHRLSAPGAFNAEIPRAELRAGPNEVRIRGRTLAGEDFGAAATLHYTPARVWPLPYRIDWSKVDDLQQVAEVVDGRWAVSPEGVRTLDPYYDRVIAVGDDSWTDYEAVVEVTYHRVLPDADGRSLSGPPYLDHAHASLALRWRGHRDDRWRPRRDWTDLGAIVMLRTDHGPGPRPARWWIHLGTVARSQTKQFWGPHQEAIRLNEPYRYRVRVETVADEGARYSAKAWLAAAPEPDKWQIVGNDPAEQAKSGALLLVAHHADVTFGNLEVVPLD